MFAGLKRLFVYKKFKKYHKILVVGGYGYKNTGDEAQLNANLKMLKKEFPDYLIKVLTPNQRYTYLEHEQCLVGEAPRVAFFNQGESQLYKLDTPFKRIKFLIIGFLLYINAYLIRAGLSTFLLTAKRAALLYEMFSSDGVFFSGGGYLTEKTLSRLWDGIFLIRIADVFKVPVFLSGQTIGVWSGKFTKIFAKWGLSKAKIITTRDPEDSLLELRKIGIEGKHIFSTFDDATFCEKLKDDKQIRRILINVGLSENDLSSGFFVMNFHYWSLNTQEDRRLILFKINSIISWIRSTYKQKILFIPMVPQDEIAMQNYLEEYTQNDIYFLKYDYSFKTIKSIIGNSMACVTMKHHPIIFALGEEVPVISLALGKYYKHKNCGALKIFGLEKYNVLMEKENYLQQFQILFDELIKNQAIIKKQIHNVLENLSYKKAHFIDLIKKSVDNREHGWCIVKVKKDRNYILYGTGRASEIVTDFIRKKGGSILYYIDSNPDKWGSEFMGKKVCCLEEIFQIKPDDSQIVIASSFTCEILSNLKKHGLKKGREIIVPTYKFY